jgi:DNA-binding transcriptional MerR regulator
MVQSGGAKALRSGTLAKAAGVSPDTIRHHDKDRHSSPGLANRIWLSDLSSEYGERVLVVRRALRIGFTLAELAEVLQARDAGGALCQRVYQLAQEKIEGMQADIDALKRTQRYLRNVLADWERRMQQTEPGQKSHLLHSLTEALEYSLAAKNKFRRKKRL